MWIGLPGASNGVLAQIADAVAAEQGDAPLLQPWQHVVVEAGKLDSACPTARAPSGERAARSRTSRMSPVSTWMPRRLLAGF